VKCYDGKMCKHKKSKYYSWENCRVCNKHQKWKDTTFKKHNRLTI